MLVPIPDPAGGGLPGTVDDLPISQTEEDRESEISNILLIALPRDYAQTWRHQVYFCLCHGRYLNAVGQPIQNNLEELTATVANPWSTTRRYWDWICWGC